MCAEGRREPTDQVSTTTHNMKVLYGEVLVRFRLHVSPSRGECHDGVRIVPVVAPPLQSEIRKV